MLQLDFSSIAFQAIVDNGQVVAFYARIWLCESCFYKAEFGVSVDTVRGNARLHMKGYEPFGQGGHYCPCCGLPIEGGQEVLIFIDAA